MSTEHQPPEGVDPDALAQQGTDEQGQGGAESYGGDPDSEPSVTEEDIETGMERDQAEG
jgi:hypothetical protein